jgi:hypothetical protein
MFPVSQVKMEACFYRMQKIPFVLEHMNKSI